MSRLNYEEEARVQRQKINYFNSKTGNRDFDKAIDHLIISDWDEKKAVEFYLNMNKKKKAPQKNLPSIKSNNFNNNTTSNRNKNLPPIKNINTKQQSKIQIISKNNNYNITEINITDELLKNNIPYKSKDYGSYTNFIKYIQNKFMLVEKTLEGFLKSLKEHPGIIILINNKKFDEFKKHAPKIINNYICPDINKISVLFAIMSDSFIGNKLVNQFSCYNFPSYIFCQYQSQKLIKVNGKMEGVFNINLFIDNVLKCLPDTKAQLKASLKTSLKASIMHNYNNDSKDDDFSEDFKDVGSGSEELNNLVQNLGKNDNNQNKNKIKDSIFGLSDGQIFQKREQEIKELERQQEEKKRKEEEEKQKIIDEENKIKKRMEDYQKEAEISKKLLPDEPSEDNPDVCRIILRYPDGEKTIERRFLKTEKVNVLYIFVKSKGREIFFEQESNDFDLIFGFPPKNLDNSKNNSLEDEGLFPNAIIQIRELD